MSFENPRGGGGSRVSLSDDYDGRRVVNTPLSLHACQLEGVDPYSLTITGRRNAKAGDDDDAASNTTSGRRAGGGGGSPNKRDNMTSMSLVRSSARSAKDNADALFDAAMPASREQQALKERFIEHRRITLLTSVLRTYKKLSAPRSTLPPPPLVLSGDLPDMTEKHQFSRKPKSVTSTLRRLADQDRKDEDGFNDTLKSGDAGAASLKNATVLSADNSLEVARYYAQLEERQRRAWEANLRTELRDKEEKERRAQQVHDRDERMATHSQMTNSKVATARTRHEEEVSRKMSSTQRNMQREEERMQRALERRQQMQEEARLRGMTRGDDQRARADRAEMNRQQKIAEKRQEKEEMLLEASMRREQDDHVRLFEKELAALAQRDTALRAQRANEYKKLMFEERVNVANHRERQRKSEFNDKFHDSMVQRDAVHRMKESLDHFFSALPARPAEVTPRYSTHGEPGGDLKVVPAPLLAKSAKELQRSASARKKTAAFDSSSRMMGVSTTDAALKTGLLSSRTASNALPSIEPPSWLSKEVGKLNENHRERSLSARQKQQERKVVIPNSDGLSIKRAHHDRRWPFTAPESKMAIATPKWMMQGND